MKTMFFRLTEAQWQAGYVLLSVMPSMSDTIHAVENSTTPPLIREIKWPLPPNDWREVVIIEGMEFFLIRGVGVHLVDDLEEDGLQSET